MESFLTGRVFVKSSTEETTLSYPVAEGFQPYLPPATPQTEATPGSPTLPKVEIVQENGVIQRIVVTCQCCKEIQLECLYDETTGE